MDDRPENGEGRPLTEGARPTIITRNPTVATVPAGTELVDDVSADVRNMVDAATVGALGPVGRLSWYLDGTQMLVAHFVVVDLAG